MTLPTPPTLEQRLQQATAAMLTLVKGPEPDGIHAMSDEETARLISTRICRAFAPEHFKDTDTTTGDAA